MVLEVLAGLGAGLGLLGEVQGPKREALPTSGYETYPQWLKEIYEETYAPAVIEQFNEPFRQQPMMRYEADPSDPFASQAMLNLQAYSDAIGGLFTPYGDFAAAQPAPIEQVTTPAGEGDAPITSAQEEYIAGLMEAQRMAQMPSPKFMNAEQLREYMKSPVKGFQAQQLLNPEIEGYENPYGAGAANRAATLSALGKYVQARNAAEASGMPHTQANNVAIQEAMTARDLARQELQKELNPVTYQPPKGGLVRTIMGTVAPAAGLAAFTGGMGLAGVPSQVANLTQRGFNIARQYG